MAIKMNVGIPKFFQHVLPASTYVKFEALCSIGVSFDIALFAVAAKFNTNYSNLNLPSSTSNLMKAKPKDMASYSPESIAAKKINDWVDALYSDMIAGPAADLTGGPKVVPVVSSGTNKVIEVDYSAAESVAMAIEKTKGITKKSKPVKAAPKSEPCALRDATVLGQKVKGTTPGSLYTVIALSPRVKVASKVSGAQLSLRVEWSDDAKKEEIDAIKSSGANWSTNYASLHVDAGSEAMIRRTVGAYLFGTGLSFEEYVDPTEVV